MYRRSGRRLEGEPLLQTCAAEGVEAVEERERLVEQVGADLQLSSISRRIPASSFGPRMCVKGAIIYRRCQHGKNTIYNLIACILRPQSWMRPRRSLSDRPHSDHATPTPTPRRPSTYRASQFLLHITLPSTSALGLGHCNQFRVLVLKRCFGSA